MTTPSQEHHESFTIVFCGSAFFGAEILRALLDDDRYAVPLVVTQPEKRVGKQSAAVKKFFANTVPDIARAAHCDLLQPKRIDDAAIALIASYAPDFLVVSSYGKILPQALLDVPRYGAINTHASLLPALRGASPVQQALVEGFQETGTTIMQMDAGMDTGDILAQKTLPIASDETAADLFVRLADASAALLTATLPQIAAGDVTPIAQDATQATHATIITKADGCVNWSRSARELYNAYRGLSIWPGLHTFIEKNGTPIRLQFLALSLPQEQVPHAHTPGTLFVAHGALYGATADGIIQIEQLQLEGKKPMAAQDFINGILQKNKTLMTVDHE